MNAVDSSGWIEYFTQEENAQFFIAPIGDSERLVVPTICIYEVFKRLLAERDEESALLAVGLMSHGREVDLDRKIAIDAGTKGKNPGNHRRRPGTEPCHLDQCGPADARRHPGRQPADPRATDAGPEKTI